MGQPIQAADPESTSRAGLAASQRRVILKFTLVRVADDPSQAGDRPLPRMRAFLVNLTLNYLTVGYAVTHDLGMPDGINFDNA